MRVLLILMLLAASTPVLAQPASVADQVAACKRSVEKKSSNVDAVDAYLRGLCAGAVNAIFQIGPLLDAKEKFCAPPRATAGDAMRIVIAYTEANPAGPNEQIQKVVLAALRQAWICK